MKKNIFLITSIFILLHSVQGIIIAPEYITRSPGINVTFIGQAKFGTPCLSPPYYLYEWYLNGSLIGISDEVTRDSMSLPPGKYNLTLNVTDCMNRTATDSTEIYVGNPLVAKIININAGGVSLFDSECFGSACNHTACGPSGSRGEIDIYKTDKKYTYNRTSSPGGNMLYLTYDGSLLYEITDPDVKVVFPNDCVGCEPPGFFTVVLDETSGDYYVLIGEDDFIGGLAGVPAPFCKNICNAFIQDFIPIVSEILICGATTISPPARVGAAANGYTEILATNVDTNKRIYFIFADDMSNFLKGRWEYQGIEVKSGTARLTMQNLCVIHKPKTYPVEECLLNFTGTASGGLPPYTVKWISSGDGVIDEYRILEDGGVYNLLTTPPLVPPLSEGLHNITFVGDDEGGLITQDRWNNVRIPRCCTIKTPCSEYWPKRQGPLVITGNEVSYACDIYEVCRPELWGKAREAVYCCKNNCGSGCHGECEYVVEESELDTTPGITSTDEVKKCAALYLIYGFGPAKKFMADYFWPEICCAGDSYCLNGCCIQDLDTCSCGWHSYNREAQSLPCTGYVSTSSVGWKSDVAMNKNTCRFADLPAYASMEMINTGTCCDYANSVATMLRIVGYGPREVYANTGPGHCYVLIKLPQSPKWNIIETTGNWDKPYTPYGISGYEGYPYCSYFNCRNDAGTFPCPANSEVWGC
ncbi:MAG: hypothetical protein U9Q22_03745 [Candidatus Altiarchaeota archaeon]|nr:hypothetical protein [Candidatus Altiarchaeota archaeon]